MDIKSYTYYLLSKKDYFEEELKEKLLKKGFNLNDIQEIINKLKEDGILNDEKLLERYKEKSIQKGESYLKLKKKLYSKGVENLNISFEEELQSALNLLKRSFKKEKNFDNVVKFLKNRGFRYSVIMEAAEKFLKEEE
ncbi:MAG: RecX family transcriptional regulator [Hydrogenothermaceae bacterium]|nr:RecX family transcriptional regulator [Hydrogenothermaceae bacterium]